MLTWDRHTRIVTAVVIAAAVVAAGSTAAWSESDAPAPAAASASPTTPTPSPTSTVTPEQEAAAAARVAARTAAAKAAEQAATKAATKPAGMTAPKLASKPAKKTVSKNAASTKAPARVPSGGLVCKGSGGPGAAEQKVAAIGRAINAYRASHGLRKLTISRSSNLVGHAKTMATTGGIWHSGHDNIVACVSNDSPKTMVAAWSRSAPHKAQMLRSDVHRMTVGGAVNDGWLFGAVRFR